MMWAAHDATSIFDFNAATNAMNQKASIEKSVEVAQSPVAESPVAQSPGAQSPGANASPRVCLVVATFRHDEAVEATLRAVHEQLDSPFFKIIVVDSQATGALSELIERQGWRDVDYISFADNVGSARNLAERLRLAARSGADFAYAINHDGFADCVTVHALLEAARGLERVGALYPLRYVPSRDQHDLTGASAMPLPFKGRTPPAGDLVPVDWGSSNQALYALEPIRRGLSPWSELWFGWEDMEYGWQLRQHGYSQFIATRARAVDTYEYGRHKVLGRTVFLSDKPAWYAYYLVRNLVLMARRGGQPRFYKLSVVFRVALEIASTTLFRTRKTTRYRLLLRGLLDGLRNKTGKGDVP